MVIRSLRSLFSAAAVAVLLLPGLTAAKAQVSPDGSLLGAAAGAPVPSRITAKVDNAARVTLAHTVHPLANAANDRGALTDATPLNRIQVVLKHSDAQEAALKQLIGDLHNPSSPSYHKWLTPDQFGKQFGPSDEDIAAVQGWLQSEGFTIGTLNPGHQTLEISGNAGQFKKAFGTAIHKYQVNGETHFANSADPQVPAALAPVFGGFTSLNNFRMKSYAKGLGEAKYEPATKKVSPSWTEGLNGVNFILAPSDFAVQYDLPAASSGTTGAGQTIAIINESNINVYLVNQFRSLFGLPSNPPTVILDGQDPGVDGVNNFDGANGASVEAYLDVEWAGAVAPGAAIDLVIGADTELENGLFLAAQRAVYGNIAPIMSVSFGACEVAQQTNNQFISSLWQQAAAQGITVLVSTGDSGSAGCDNDNTQYYAVKGQAVNGLASTPYNVAVGGTDFYYSAYNQGNTALSAQLGQYWNTTPSNTAPTTSIKGVIPEQPWNNSQYGLNAASYYSLTGATTIAGGSGGASTCGLYTSSSCAPYPKPSWQKGSGVPADNARDIPDVSLFAASGLNFSFYPICATDGDCQPASAGSEIQVYGVGGTSASTPAFAGIMAMVNQLYGRQGQANFTLYPLAQQFPAAFHDVNVGTNSVPCAISSTGCIAVSNPLTVNDPTYGTSVEGQIGNTSSKTTQYNAAAGYDLATGLGTIDAKVLLANWNKVTFASSTTTLTPSATSIAHGTAVTINGAVTGSGTPTGTVALMTDSGLAGQQGLTDFTLGSNGSYSGSVTTLPGGTYNIYGVYSGDGTNGTSTSAKTSVTVTPESSGTALNLLATTTSSNSLLSSGGTVQYGESLSASALMAPTAQLAALQTCVFQGTGTCPTFTTPTGNVAFTDGGTALGTVPVDAVGEAEYVYPATVGSHSLTAAYSGDASYNASTSSAVTYNVVKNTPVVGLAATNVSNSGSITGGQQTVLTVEIENSISVSGQAAAPTGTVTVSGAPAGTQTSATLTPAVDPADDAPAGLATITVPSGVTPGTYNITFAYSGDSNYNPKSSGYAIPFTAAGAGSASTTTGTVSAPSSTPAAPIVVTATVTGQSGKAPTGSVGIFSAGYEVGVISLSANGTTSASGSTAVTSQALLQGTNLLTLQYSGDTTYLGSTSTVTVANPLSDFTLTASTQNVTVPASGTITDTVAVKSIYGFTGSVALSCAATGGVTCTLSTPTVTLTNGQTLPVTVTLSGAGVTAAGSYTATLTGSDATSKYVHTVGIAVTSPKIQTGDFTLSAASSAVTVANTGSVTDMLTATSTGGFTGAVSLTCPAVSGLTCTVLPAAVTLTSGGSQGSVLTVTTSGTTPAGTYPVVATGTSGSLTHAVTIQVTVSAVPTTPDFTLSPASASVSVSTGATATDVVTVASLNSFNSAVTVTCAGVAGVTCTAAPASVTPASGGSATSTLTLTGVTAGTYNVVVTGTSGTLVHTANVTVTVSTPDFTLTPASGAVSVTLGSSASTTDAITVSAVNSFSSAVALSCSAPAGVTCTLNPTTVTGSGTSTATLTGVTAGTYTVTVTGVSGTLSHSATISVTVNAAPVPGFTLNAVASSLSVVGGGAAVQDGISVTAVNGFTGSVALACSAPSGITCTVAPASVTPGTSANISVSAAASAARLEGAPRLFSLAGGTVLAGLVCLLIPGKRKRWPALLAVMFCAAALGLTTGCGGGGSPNNPSQNYNVTVTGTSGSLTASTTVVVTVTTR